MNYIVERLKEPSTWRGIVAFLTGVGIYLSPEQQAAIITGGLAIMGILGAFFPDKIGVAPKPE